MSAARIRGLGVAGMALLSLLLVGCGFQLRREAALPAAAQVLRVEVADTFSPLQRNLERAVQRAGARLAAPGEPAARLKVPTLRFQTVPLSVTQTGRAREYALVYTAEVELLDAAGTALLPRQRVELQREYTFDDSQTLGTAGEEEVAQDELEREMVQAILRRIAARVE